MPMMLTPDILPDTLDKKYAFPYSFYGHPIRTASKCGHSVHPSSSEHVPWCPPCALSRARAKSDAALKRLAGQGGLTPPEHVRSQQWNIARKGYLVASQRFEKTRRDDQLRWEREQGWDDAHKRSGSRPVQAAAVMSQSPSMCAVCDSMSASYPTSVPEAQAAAYVAWWEKTDASRPLQQHHDSALPPSHNQHGKPAKPRSRRGGARGGADGKGDGGNPQLLQIVNHLRLQMQHRNALREAWNARNKTEAAVRRKHGLGPDFEIAAAFWDWPIPGFFSWRNYRNIQEQGRMAERRARGNTHRPRPPRSSLSLYAQSSEQVRVEPDFIETLKQREEREKLERQTRKVAGQVGYLYFVGDGGSGGMNALDAWREDIERSDKDLVVRMRRSPSDTSGSEDTQDADDDDDDEDPDWMDIDEA